MSDANTVTPVSPVASSASNDNVTAAIATIPYIGAVMFFAMKDSSDFVKFYAKQSVGLTILSLILVVVSFIGGFLPFVGLLITCATGIASLILFVAWLVLLVSALQGNKYRLPVLADLVDQYIK